MGKDLIQVDAIGMSDPDVSCIPKSVEGVDLVFYAREMAHLQTFFRIHPNTKIAYFDRFYGLSGTFKTYKRRKWDDAQRFDPLNPMHLGWGARGTADGLGGPPSVRDFLIGELTSWLFEKALLRTSYFVALTCYDKHVPALRKYMHHQEQVRVFTSWSTRNPEPEKDVASKMTIEQWSKMTGPKRASVTFQQIYDAMAWQHMP